VQWKLLEDRKGGCESYTTIDGYTRPRELSGIDCVKLPWEIEELKIMEWYASQLEKGKRRVSLDELTQMGMMSNLGLKELYDCTKTTHCALR
jgi:hypothetical protein